MAIILETTLNPAIDYPWGGGSPLLKSVTTREKLQRIQENYRELGPKEWPDQIFLLAPMSAAVCVLFLFLQFI